MSQDITSQDIQPATATAETVSNKEQAQADNQPAKVYTQVDLDAIAAETRRKTEARFAKKYENIDVEKYQSLMQKEEEQKKLAEAILGRFGVGWGGRNRCFSNV